ncbi:MAG: ABC transporter ATP-binding protein [Chitinophagales bacterium]|nr:ABC transporter ATP-binding protein [Chitinophagales bacterium]
MIEAIDIHKFYGDLHILKGVSVKVSQGEIVSIVGPSGAGKSTLLHILGTLDRASQGTVLFEGNDVFRMNDKKLGLFRNQHIGFVFQFHHLLPEFTAIENVMIPGFIAKKNNAAVKEKAIELLSYLGLRERIQHKPAELSGGEQQRVAVARSLINDPKIILADEPSGNLDTDHARELHELFFTLRKKLNQTFVIVTHNEELASMADRKLVMKDGEISD